MSLGLTEDDENPSPSVRGQACPERSRRSEGGYFTMTPMKQLSGFLITFLVISLSGCSSGVDSEYFSNYGLEKGDVISIEITGPFKKTQWTDDQQYNTAALDTGASMQLSLVGYDVANNSINALPGTWVSSDQGVAAVDSTGKITAISAGDTEVTVKLLSTVTGEVVSDTIVITVLPSPVLMKPWTESSVHLRQAMWDHASAVWNGYLYVAGGNSDCTADYENCGFTDMVYYAPINQDGSIAPFSQTTVLPRFLRGHTLLAYNGYMYVIGGIIQPYYTEPPYPDPNSFNTKLNEKVFYAKINPDGSLGSWAETTPLPPSDKIPEEKRTPESGGLFGLSATAHTVSVSGADKGYMYVTGGWSGDLKKNVETVLVGPINESDGTISSWLHNALSDLPYDLSKHTSVAATVNGDNYLYVVGGNSGGFGSQVFHNEILYAKIANDGILSPWKYSSKVLPVQLIDHATASLGRYIFVFGGRDGDGGSDEKTPYNIYKNVIYYYIDDTGDLQSLQRLADLPAPLFHHAAAADINKLDNSINLYVTGGAGGNTDDQTNRKDTVYYITNTP